MPTPFLDRLIDYYASVSSVLRGEVEPSRIFPNTTDKGISREDIYIEFLRRHAPTKCAVRAGGFLFSDAGQESKQLDIFITGDGTRQFDLGKKSFACVDGSIAAFSIKSHLDKKELVDSLENLASIPPHTDITGKISPILRATGFDDWPYKVIYASNGIANETLWGHYKDFFTANPTIPITRRPNVIHVAGKYFWLRADGGGQTRDGKTAVNIPTGDMMLSTTMPDVQAIVNITTELQNRAQLVSHILFDGRTLRDSLIEAMLKHDDEVSRKE